MSERTFVKHLCACVQYYFLCFLIFIATQLSGDKFGNNYDFSSCLPSVVNWLKCATHLLLIKEWQENTFYVFNRSCSFIGGKWSTKRQLAMFENGSNNFKFSFIFKSDHFHVFGAFEKNPVYQRFYTLGCHRRRKNSVTGKLP